MFNKQKSLGEAIEALRQCSSSCRWVARFIAVGFTIGAVLGFAYNANVPGFSCMVLLPILVAFWNFLAAVGDLLAAQADETRGRRRVVEFNESLGVCKTATMSTKIV